MQSHGQNEYNCFTGCIGDMSGYVYYALNILQQLHSLQKVWVHIWISYEKMYVAITTQYYTKAPLKFDLIGLVISFLMKLWRYFIFNSLSCLSSIVHLWCNAKVTLGQHDVLNVRQPLSASGKYIWHEWINVLCRRALRIHSFTGVGASALALFKSKPTNGIYSNGGY